jgi:hypothetical protein
LLRADAGQQLFPAIEFLLKHGNDLLFIVHYGFLATQYFQTGTRIYTEKRGFFFFYMRIIGYFNLVFSFSAPVSARPRPFL